MWRSSHLEESGKKVGEGKHKQTQECTSRVRERDVITSGLQLWVKRRLGVYHHHECVLA